MHKRDMNKNRSKQTIYALDTSKVQAESLINFTLLCTDYKCTSTSRTKMARINSTKMLDI